MIPLGLFCFMVARSMGGGTAGMGGTTAEQWGQLTPTEMPRLKFGEHAVNNIPK